MRRGLRATACNGLAAALLVLAAGPAWGRQGALRSGEGPPPGVRLFGQEAPPGTTDCRQGVQPYGSAWAYIEGSPHTRLLAQLLSSPALADAKQELSNAGLREGFADTLVCPTDEALREYLGGATLEQALAAPEAAQSLSALVQYWIMAGRRTTYQLDKGAAYSTRLAGHALRWQADSTAAPSRAGGLARSDWLPESLGGNAFVDERGAKIPVVCENLPFNGRGLIQLVGRVPEPSGVASPPAALAPRGK